MFRLTPFTGTPTKRTQFSDFENLIDDFFSGMPMRTLRHDTFKLDVRQDGETYLIEADLPGVKKEEVHVSYDDGLFTIAVERQEETEDKHEGYLHRERRMSSMKRSINLPDLDPQQIKARLEEGVLKVVAEKQAVQDTRTVIDIE
ncbi:MAG: Hsp20/alpha crystallin family protein [Acholeplasmatales bacterium]|nr:MAG: Hsp20/alpha crystallin family protein [Acholeplasmatales bacterium]